MISPRLRGQVTIAAGLAVVIAGGGWFYTRLDHIGETDARVMGDMVTISSRIDGWVVERPVTDGQTVKAGDILAVIDQREAAQQVEELNARAMSIRLDRERAEARLAIVSGSSVSAVNAAQARRAAQARLGEAEASLADARAHLGDADVLRKEVERLSHDGEQIEAQRRQHEIALADRVVRSPVDGIVDQKFVEPGEYVIPGQRLLLLHDPKAVWVEANVKETKLERIRPGQSVAVAVDAYPDRAFSGRIERIGNATTSQFALLPSPNPSGNFTKITQRVPLRIAVTQQDDAPLRPGMMVEIDIDVGRH